MLVIFIIICENNAVADRQRAPCLLIYYPSDNVLIHILALSGAFCGAFDTFIDLLIKPAETGYFLACFGPNGVRFAVVICFFGNLFDVFDLFNSAGQHLNKRR